LRSKFDLDCVPPTTQRKKKKKTNGLLFFFASRRAFRGVHRQPPRGRAHRAAVSVRRHASEHQRVQDGHFERAQKKRQKDGFVVVQNNKRVQQQQQQQRGRRAIPPSGEGRRTRQVHVYSSGERVRVRGDEAERERVHVFCVFEERDRDVSGEKRMVLQTHAKEREEEDDFLFAFREDAQRE